MSTEPAAVINVHPADYVTKRELDATVKPLQDDVSEIKADVKTLLADRAGRKAIRGVTRTVGGIAVALIAGAGGSAFLAFLIH